MIKQLLRATALLAALCGSALAQSSPGLFQGQVPTPAQWNSYFAAKQDVLSYTPVNKAGDIMTGPLITAAPISAAAGFNLPPGTSPSSPNNGDLWSTTAGIFTRVNNVTMHLGGSQGNNNWGGDQYFASGRPWCDVRGAGALGNGVTDDSGAFLACVSQLQSLGGGIMFVPPGSYCIKNQVSWSGSAAINLVGSGVNTANLMTCGANITPIRPNVVLSTVRDLTIEGPNFVGATGDAILMDTLCVACTVERVRLFFGRRNMTNLAGDHVNWDVTGQLPYGDAMQFVDSGGFENRVAWDTGQAAGTCTSVNSAPYAAWSASSTVAHCEIRTTTDLATGESWYVQAVQAGSGVTGGTAPVLNGMSYGQNITDNTVTWNLIMPSNAALVIIDSHSALWSSIHGDFSGFVSTSLLIQSTTGGSGPQAVLIKDSDFTSNNFGIHVTAGQQLTLNGVTVGGGVNNPAGVGIQFDGTFTGAVTIQQSFVGNWFTGINVTVGNGYVFNANTIWASGISGATTGINIGANISGVSIRDNNFVGPTGTIALATGVHLTGGVSANNYRVAGNICTGGGVPPTTCVVNSLGAAATDSMVEMPGQFYYGAYNAGNGVLISPNSAVNAITVFGHYTAAIAATYDGTSSFSMSQRSDESGWLQTASASNIVMAPQGTGRWIFGNGGGFVQSGAPDHGPGQISVGVSTGTVGGIWFANLTSGTIQLIPATGALGSAVATLPANTGTIAELNLAQTWTATQTMGTIAGSSGVLTLNGSTNVLINPTVNSGTFGFGTSTPRNFEMVTSNNSTTYGSSSGQFQFNMRNADTTNGNWMVQAFYPATGYQVVSGFAVQTTNHSIPTGIFHLLMGSVFALNAFSSSGITIGAGLSGSDPGASNLGVLGAYMLGSNNTLFASGTAPTLSAGFCTSPSVSQNNGTIAFEITVGTACAAGTGTIGMPAASHNWTCVFADVTNPGSHVVRQTGGTTTTVTVQDYSATTGAAQNMGSSDLIRAHCSGY